MQNSVLAIKKAIKSLVSPINSQVYYEDTPDSAVFPYVTWLHQGSTADGANTEQFPVEIDCWDDAQDKTILETLVQDIINALDKTVVIDGVIALRFELSGRFPVYDPDVRLSRRKINFDCRVIQVR